MKQILTSDILVLGAHLHFISDAFGRPMGDEYIGVFRNPGPAAMQRLAAML